MTLVATQMAVLMTNLVLVETVFSVSGAYQDITGAMADGNFPLLQGLTLVTAALGWLGFTDAACLDWLRHRHITREQLRDMLVAALFGALMAAASVEPAVELQLG